MNSLIAVGIIMLQIPWWILVKTNLIYNVQIITIVATEQLKYMSSNSKERRKWGNESPRRINFTDNVNIKNKNWLCVYKNT